MPRTAIFQHTYDAKLLIPPPSTSTFLLETYLFMEFSPLINAVRLLLCLSHASLSCRYFAYPAKLSAFCNIFSIFLLSKNQATARQPFPFLHAGASYCLPTNTALHNKRNENTTPSLLSPVKKHVNLHGETSHAPQTRNTKADKTAPHLLSHCPNISPPKYVLHLTSSLKHRSHFPKQYFSR